MFAYQTESWNKLSLLPVQINIMYIQNITIKGRLPQHYLNHHLAKYRLSESAWSPLIRTSLDMTKLSATYLTQLTVASATQFLLRST